MDNSNKRRLEDNEEENGAEEQSTNEASAETEENNSNNNALVVKKQKTEGEIVAIPSDERSKQLAVCMQPFPYNAHIVQLQTIQRTSNLQAPIMLLSGHKVHGFPSR